MAPRAEVIDRGDIESALEIDPDTQDPNLHYRFVHPRNMAKRKAQGYEVVLRSETKVRLLGDEPKVKTADDLVRVGELILMTCAKERHTARAKQRESLSSARLGSAEARFKTEAKKRGVRSLTDKEGE